MIKVHSGLLVWGKSGIGAEELIDYFTIIIINSIPNRVK